MYLSRRYVVALIVALVAVVAYVVVPRVTTAIHDNEAHDALVAADAAFRHLTVPTDFVALRSDANCQWYPCYRVPRDTASVRPQLPAILTSAGAHPLGPLQKQCPARLVVGIGCADYGRSHGYQVLVSLGPETTTCLLKRHHPPHCPDSIVQITTPYIPETAQPENGGSGWPLSNNS